MEQTINPARPIFIAWAAGELSDRAAAEALARELIEIIEPQERALKQYKDACRDELGTLLIRLGEPVPVNDRIARWVEPTTTESANVKQLRALIADLRQQGSPAHHDIATRIEVCLNTSARKGYPLLEAPTRRHSP
jgi:hypothetical protein